MADSKPPQVIHAHGIAAIGSFSASGTATVRINPPPILLTLPILLYGARTEDGSFVTAITAAWEAMLNEIERCHHDAHIIPPRVWEEIVAATWERAGFQVTLTPRSADHGRDVIAVKHGFGSIRILDQVKAYKPDHIVPANDVRAMLGTVLGDQAATKGVITTTSTFAPRLLDDPMIRAHVPYRLELKDRSELFRWLDEVKRNSPSQP